MKRILRLLYKNLNEEELVLLSQALFVMYAERSDEGMNLDDDGHWYTTEEGRHYHVNEGGAVDKGFGGKLNGVKVGESKKI